MLFSVFYVGDSCQGWGREFESRFPLQIQKALIERLGLFIVDLIDIYSSNYNYLLKPTYKFYCPALYSVPKM